MITSELQYFQKNAQSVARAQNLTLGVSGSSNQSKTPASKALSTDMIKHQEIVDDKIKA